MLRLLLAWLAAVPSAALLVSPATAAASSYSKLQGVELLRATDGAPVEVTSLWRSGVFGLGGEKAVLVFMVRSAYHRHARLSHLC